MGIKNFQRWFSRQFAKEIKKIRPRQKLSRFRVSVDNLIIDCNGLYHNATQRVFQYGEHKPKKRLLGRRKKRSTAPGTLNLQVVQQITAEIEKIVQVVGPRKRLILCVDGPAPISKQNQQRQRRFRSALERLEATPGAFDSNCLTPGTTFMRYISSYIDWYIRRRISQDEALWGKLDVIFSSEQVAGEGEHKGIQYLRFYGDQNESYCIHGLDADLIMLALATHVEKFYVLRDDLYDHRNDYLLVDIGAVRRILAQQLEWSGKQALASTDEAEESKDEPMPQTPQTTTFSSRWAINDFVLACYMCGNDFLPHIPSIEIIEGGITVIIETLQRVGHGAGHISVENESGSVRLHLQNLRIFLGEIGAQEQALLQEKLLHKENYFPDELLEQHAQLTQQGTWQLDLPAYKDLYYRTHFGKDYDLEKICHQYIEGFQWVLSYYTEGVPNWRWCLPYQYAPFASDLAEHMTTFQFPVYGRSQPTPPFQQLLSVLPPASASLLPRSLAELLTDPESPLQRYCPDEVKVDVAGKRQEWEGIVCLPVVEWGEIKDEYLRRLRDLTPTEVQRNRAGQSYVFRRSAHVSSFNSPFGTFRQRVETEVIRL